MPIREPIVITEKQYPFRIKYVNKAWIELCGYTFDEIRNKSILILRTNENVSYINKKKGGNKFVHIFKIYHLLNYSVAITKYAYDLQKKSKQKIILK